ncbi:MAG: mechanosensitive ion channel domain-containing protein [Rhodanobacter sp.]
MAVVLAPATLAKGSQQVGKWADLNKTIGGINFDLGSIVAAILLFIGFLVASAILKRALRRFAKRNQSVNQSTLYTVERLLHYLLLIIGLLWALGVAGIPMAKMTVFAGAVGVGLGFGLQAIFNNFVSGLILLFDRSLKVGDFVELASGVHGHVREIRIRATLISTNDNIDILVPNSEFVTGRVVNWTLREAARRQRIPFRVPYGTDKELVKTAALEAAAAVPFTLSMEGPREPQVWLTGFGESSLDFALVVWLNAVATRRVGRVLAAYNWALHTALEQRGIEIPFPQRDLHVRSWVAPASSAGVGAGRGGSKGTLDNDALRDVQRDIDEAPGGAADSPSPHDPDAAR